MEKGLNLKRRNLQETYYFREVYGWGIKTLPHPIAKGDQSIWQQKEINLK